MNNKTPDQQTLLYKLRDAAYDLSHRTLDKFQTRDPVVETLYGYLWYADTYGVSFQEWSNCWSWLDVAARFTRPDAVEKRLVKALFHAEKAMEAESFGVEREAHLIRVRENREVSVFELG